MNPRTFLTESVDIAKPRSRGDEPSSSSVAISKFSKTPLTRG